MMITTQFYSISIPNPPQPVSFGNHTFFTVCESVYVLLSPLYPFLDSTYK